MQIRDQRNRSLRFEPLEARLVLSCDFTGDGACDIDDLDALYDAGAFSVSASATVFGFGVGGGGSVSYDLFVTTKADIEFISGRTELQGFFNPNAPALYDNADYSWIRTPSSPAVAYSGSFTGSVSQFASDEVDDGPVKRFHFSRLTLVMPEQEQIPVRFDGALKTRESDGSNRFHTFSIDLPNSASSRFNYDQDDIIDSRDIPGWLASASFHDPNNDTFRIGDVNLDGNVDSSDWGALLNNFSTTAEPSSDVGWGDGDLNMSGTVDDVDLGLVLNNFGFDSQASFASASQAAEAIDAFAADLYEELQKEEGNVAFSPLSIATALSMAYAGANGTTATEMANVLHLGDESGIHSSFSDLLSSYEQVTEPTEILVANSIWPSSSYPVRGEYAGLVGEYYRGSAGSLDYTNPSLAEEVINGWIAEHTNNRITDLVQNLSSETVLVLANALFFESFWDLPFSPESTTNSSFTTADGSVVNVEMMRAGLGAKLDHGIRFTEVDGFQAMEMPFRGGAASMVFMLSPLGADLPSETLTQINAWAGTPEPMQSCIDVGLPKFETTVSTDLSRLLPQMGMPTAFTNGAADFTNAFHEMGPFIEQVNHKAFLRVNEVGAEAAASTNVDFSLCFAAGTPVLTPSGVAPIEEIQVGDVVFSRAENDPDGTVTPKVVEELFRGEKPVIQIQVAGRTLRPTHMHRFYVKDRGWIAAIDLQVGDLLSSHHGEWTPVESVTVNLEVVSVYNFRVADYHTYFVGDEENAVWTHNCYEGRSFYANRPFHFSIRDNVNSTTIMMGRIDDPTQLTNALNPGKSAATSENIEPSVGDQGKTTDSILRAFPLVETSGETEAADVRRQSSLAHEAMEPCVSDDLSVESLMAAFDRVQGRGQFAVSSVDQVMQEDSLSLDWVESLDKVRKLAAF